MKMDAILNSGWRRIIIRDLFLFWILATAALCLALLVNQLREQPLTLTYQSKEARMQESVSRIGAVISTSSAKKQALPANLSLEEFRSYVEKKDAVILDARPEIFHRLGHVPGALSLARDDFEKSYAKLKDRLERDKSQTLVLYCSSSSCEDSHLVQTALLRLGYSNVAIFTGGWAAWTQAKLPEESNP